jgi:hypothetical protein
VPAGRYITTIHDNKRKMEAFVTEGVIAVAKSLNRSRHKRRLRRLRRLRWQGRSSRPCRQIDGGVTRRANPEPSRQRRCPDEPPSPLILSHFQLAAGLNAILIRRHRCLLGFPTYTWLSFRARRRDLEHLQLTPLSFSLACSCALPSSLFSPAPVSPCASRTRHGLTTRHFSH